ncbi:MAG: PKD domain-containing protein, partial [Bacteroidota bacterium]
QITYISWLRVANEYYSPQLPPMIANRYPFHHSWLILVLFALTIGNLGAQQEFQIDQHTLISTCSGIFIDDGGVGGNHDATGTETITICSNSTAPNETHIRLSFSLFEIEGEMLVYNSDFADPNALINTLNPENNTTFPVMEASAGNPSGCLTIVFNPAGSDQGWNAAISCVRACQPVVASLASSDPVVMPVDTGYIDICMGDRVSFTGAGIYPENNLIYAQSDATSTFEWNFEDGSTATGPNVTNVFEEAGGYTVQLTITDVNGCRNNNQISQRVRVAPKANFDILANTPDLICASEIITLASSTENDPNPDPTSNVFASTEEQTFSVGQVLSDTTFLPDGSGVEYTTSIEFGNFPFGATVTSINDIIGICLNMEHSFAGDLDLWIECPNGQEVALVEYPNSLGGQYVGQPIDQDNLLQGVGFDYCFTPEAGLLTWVEAVDQLNIGGGQSIPAGDYAPEESMAGLIGCPLNGEWTINVRDNLSIDNGFIFNWGVTFADYLFPNLETFRVGIDSSYWEEVPNLSFFSPDSIESTPPYAGMSAFTYTIIDSFGCISDTTLLIDVLPFSDPDCYECQPMLDSTSQTFVACNNTTVQTSLASITTLDTTIQWADYPLQEFGFSTHPNQANAFESTIAVNSIRPITLTDAQTQIESVCVEIETFFTDEVSLFLRAPNGSLLELSTNNGL